MKCTCGKVTTNKKFCSRKCAAKAPRTQKQRFCKCGIQILKKEKKCKLCSLPKLPVPHYKLIPYLYGLCNECEHNGQKHLYLGEYENKLPTMWEALIDESQLLCRECLIMMWQADGLMD